MATTICALLLLGFVSGQLTGFVAAFNFTSQPSDTTESEENEVVSIKCQAEGTADLPFWLINDRMFFSLDLPAGYRADRVGLHFSAYSSFNGTTYQCLYMQIENSQKIVRRSTRSMLTVKRVLGNSYTLPRGPLKTCKPTIFGISTITTGQLSTLRVSWNQIPGNGGCLTVDSTACLGVNYHVELGTCSGGRGIVSNNILATTGGMNLTVPRENLQPLTITLGVTAIGYEGTDWILLPNSTQETEILNVKVGDPLFIPDLNSRYDESDNVIVCISKPDSSQDICCSPNPSDLNFIDGLNFAIDDNNDFALSSTSVRQEWNNWKFMVVIIASISTENCDLECNSDISNCTTVKLLTKSFKLVVSNDVPSPVPGPVPSTSPSIVPSSTGLCIGAIVGIAVGGAVQWNQV